MDQALRYADSQGVLVILPVADYALDLDRTPMYPNRNLADGVLENILTVAASDSSRNPLPESNYGAVSLDLYAPGVNIFSSYTGDTYRLASGSRVAASVVSGIAALLKSYYPELTPAQIRSLLIENVTRRDDAELEKQVSILVDGKIERSANDLFFYEELCHSGGIVNAYQAIRAADALTRSF
ncbi:MAG: S8 family serine peptidase [Rikenellaceae bacterium]|nr:S8 family serine peptidase [Rikenellaceae bacterium]